MNMDSISNMVFNPLARNDCNVPLFECDPNKQFYNELRIIYHEINYHHFEDQFNDLVSSTECSQIL